MHLGRGLVQEAVGRDGLDAERQFRRLGRPGELLELSERTIHRGPEGDRGCETTIAG
jgi:hypothetical protein